MTSPGTTSPDSDRPAESPGGSSSGIPRGTASATPGPGIAFNPAEPLPDRTLGRRVARFAAIWRRELDIELRPFGLTEAQWRPLFWLGRLGDRPSQADLARALNLEAPSLVRLIDVLERAGFVERLDDPADRRVKRLQMTRDGQDRYAQIERACEAVEQRLMRGVSAEEEAICLAIFERIEANLRTGEGGR